MFAILTPYEKFKEFLPIFPVYLIIFEVIFTMNYSIIFNSSCSIFFRFFSLIFFQPLSIMTIVTHIKCMFTSPGYVPIPFKPIVPNSSNYNVNSHEYCKKCNNPRPERAHHCKICKKCTLKMDHHCPWVYNCVGYYNQKNFYQFLFYATFGDLMGFILLFIKCYNTDFTIEHYIPKDVRISNPFQLGYYFFEPIQTVVGCLCAFAMTVSIGTLFNKQTNMLLNNQTTIEKKMYSDWENSPFYEKDKMKSFCSVMGNTYRDWISLKFDGEDPFSFEKVKRYQQVDFYK